MTLKTSRCTMNILAESDFPEAINLFTNEQVRKYLGGAIEKKQAYDKLQKWVSSKDLYLCIRHTLTNDLIGIVSVNYHDSQSQSLSYQFMPQWWGRGIAEEALGELLNYLKQMSNRVELIAETQSLNTRSCKLLEKLGFEFYQTVFRFDAEQKIYKLILSQTPHGAL